MSTRFQVPGGFLLLESLILLLILSIGFVSFAGFLSQALRVSTQTSRTTIALNEYEMLLFQMENGLRPDLAAYGGTEILSGGLKIDLRTDLEKNYSFIHGKLIRGQNKEALLEQDFLVSQGMIE